MLFRLLAPLSCAMILASAGASASATSPAYQVYFFDEPRALTVDAARVAILAVGADGRGLAALDGEIGASLAVAGIDVGRAERRVVDGWWLAPIDDAARAGRTTVEVVRDAVASTARLAGRGVGRVDMVSPVFIDDLGGPMHPTPQILVRFAPDVDAHTVVELLGGANAGVVAEADWGGMPGAYRIGAASRDGAEVLAAANALAQHPQVIYAEPDMVFTGRGGLIPNDTGFINCWGLHNTGQFGGSVVDVDMNAVQAWDTTLGSPSILTVVIDTGVQQDHPDINQIAGYDTTTDAGNGGPVNAFDNHGTPVGGCVSGRANNALGTAGSAPSTRVISARTFISINANGNWNSTASWTVNSLVIAEGQGARVSNNSNFYGFTSSAIANTYTSTRNNGMVHFASAGNDNIGSVTYPSSLPTVMAIGALNLNGAKSSFSNFGPLLAFVAPGSTVYSTDRTGASGYGAGDYVFVQGTSFASPYAAGVAALLLSRCDDLTAAQVEAKLFDSCRDLGVPGRDDTFGEGLIRADDAISSAGLVPCAFDLVAPANFSAGVSRTPTLDWSDAVWADSYTVEVLDALSVAVLTQLVSAGSHLVVPGGVLAYNKTYTWSVLATNAEGDSPASPSVFQFTTVPSPCTGDVNNDGLTNAADFTILAGSFGSSVPAGTLGDLNGDGVVNASDFTILAGDFGCSG